MTKEEKEILIIADPEILRRKEIKIQLFVRDMLDSQFVDMKTRKTKRSMTKRSEEVIGTDGRRKVFGDTDKAFVKLGIYEEIGKKERLIHLPKNKYVIVRESTADKLSTLLSDNAAKVYVYLLNNYKIWNIEKHIPFCFTKAQLCSDVLGITVQGSNSDRMEDILTTLVANGLISYSIIKKEGYQGFYRRLNYASQDFILHEVVKERIKQVTQGLEECTTAKEGLLAVGVEEEVFSVGYNPNNSLNGDNVGNMNLLGEHQMMVLYFSTGVFRPFISVEESCDYLTRNGRKVTNIDELIDWLSKPWAGNRNDEIIAYLKSIK